MTRIAIILLATSTVVLSSGCDSSSDVAPPGPSTLLSQRSFQWTARNGIDLLTGPVVPIRAYLESRLVAQTTDSLDYTYPGFSRAIEDAGNDTSERLGATDVLPVLKESVSAAPIGTNRFRIINLVHTDRSTVVATVCNYRYSVATERAGGEFLSVAASEGQKHPGIDALRIEVRSGETPAVLPQQRGPEPAPVTDVFGTWRVTQVLSGFLEPFPEFGAAWPTFGEDTAACAAEAPDSAERRIFLITGEHPRSDFPTLRPDPGWPERTE